MASEPRTSTAQLPLYSRASDRDIFDCPGKWVLNYLEEDRLPETGWFMMGDTVHQTIEAIVLEDMTLEDAEYYYAAEWDATLGLAKLRDVDPPIIWSSKRDEATTHDIGLEAVRRWFDHVHPTGTDRLPVFEDYEWPPRVEVLLSVEPGPRLEAPLQGIRTEADAIFLPKRKRTPAMIVDWKTGSRAHASETQLHLYFYAARLAGELPWNSEFRGGFVHLGAGKEAKWQEAGAYPGDLNMKAMFDATTALKGTMKAGDVMFRRDWWCGTCRAREVCPVEGTGDIVKIRRQVMDAEWITSPVHGWGK